MVVTSPDAPIDVLITPDPDEHRAGGGRPDLVPGAPQVPDLKVALSEGGIGWIPYFLERIDYNYKQHHTGPARTSATSCPARSSTSTS